MTVGIEQVTGRKATRTFIHLPAKLYAEYHQWIPPFYSDMRKLLNPRHNRALSYCDSILFLARSEGRVVGRIMGIVNRRHNEMYDLKTTRFGFFAWSK